MQTAIRLLLLRVLILLSADSWAPSECQTIVEDVRVSNASLESDDTERVQNASASTVIVSVNTTGYHGPTTSAEPFTTQTFTEQPTCSGVALPPRGHAVTGTTCAGNMSTGEACRVLCAEGLQPVGFFYCANDGFVGAPSCELSSAAKETVTKFIGTFEFIVRLQRVPGLGVAFRNTVLLVLAESLVVPAVDILRLEVELENQGTAGSAIRVSFELIVRKTYWVAQITTDLHRLDDADSPVHQEVAKHMEDAGYPVVGIRRLATLIIFKDEVVAQVTSIRLEEDSLPLVKTLFLAGAILLLVCSSLCLLRAAYKWRKTSCGRSSSGHESSEQYQAPCV